jgi:glucose/arabinose dehydrogenase
LSVPPGFKVDVYASDLNGPRRMLSAANGDVFVSETQAGRISLLRPSPDGSKAASKAVFVDGLRQPFGIAFYPDAKNPQWLYVAETHRVVRYPYKTGDSKAGGAPEVVVPKLASGGGHFTRDIAFSLDGKRLFVSVGSVSNVAEDMSKKSPEQARAWEVQHGFGTSWDIETDRAVVLAFDATAPSRDGKVFASGIRNCVGIVTQPKTGDVWCTTNERDMLGDDLVPDYSTRVKEGAFYGWPWYYIGSNEDPRLKGDRPDLKGKVTVPDVLYQAHSAALNLTFYPQNQGKSAFPEEYAGDGFAVFHGSWNRNFRTGHKVVRVRMKDGVPTGEYEDFLTGFIVDDGDAWGRPVAAAVLNDGSLLMSDDLGDTLYRISYTR